jgi:hypothetical protein
LPKKTSIKDRRGLKIGDLVTHALYGKEWIGLVLDFVVVKDSELNSKERALVQIQPGTKYEYFFKDALHNLSKVRDNLGYVSIHWLFKLDKQQKREGKK